MGAGRTRDSPLRRARSGRVNGKINKLPGVAGFLSPMKESPINRRRSWDTKNAGKKKERRQSKDLESVERLLTEFNLEMRNEMKKLKDDEQRWNAMVESE